MSESVNFSSQHNVGGNSSGICSISVDSKEIKISIHVFTLVVALVGNSLLIAAYKRIKEPLMFFIANMAASDLLTAIFLVPRLITVEIVDSLAWQVQGLGGTILCKMCTFLSDISLSVSTQSLVIIAVERFLAVVHPVKTRSITKKIRRFLIALTWIVAMAIHMPYFYAFELVNHSERGNITICENKWITYNWPAYLRYVIFLYVTVLLIPLIVISILYPITVVYLRKDNMATHRSNQGAKRRRERTMNLFKLAVATVLLLIICWVPYSVIHLLQLFAPPGTLCNRIFVVTEYVSRVLASSYCAVNPFICFIFLRTFRGELGVICKRWKGRASTIIDGKSRSRTMTGTGFKDSRIKLLQMNVHPQTPTNSVQDLL